MSISLADARVRITTDVSGEQEIERLRAQVERLRASVSNYNNVNRQGAGGDRQRQASMMMAGQQMQDFAMQVQLGTDPIRAFSMQAGQMGLALAGMGETAGKFGKFISGPWGSLIMVGVTTLLMFKDEIFGSTEALKELEGVSVGVGSAQAALAGMFDLATGKIADNTAEVKLNTLAKIANMQVDLAAARKSAAEAMRKAQSVSFSAAAGNQALRQSAMGMGGDYMAAERMAPLMRKADPRLAQMLRDASDPTKAAAALRQAVDPKFASSIDFKSSGITLDEFRQGIIDTASVQLGEQAVADALKAYDTGKLPSSLRRTRSGRSKKTEAPKVSPFDQAMTSIGGDNEQLQQQLDLINKYGEAAASTKAVLVEWNIEHGKYGKISDEQKTKLLEEAKRYDTLKQSLADATKAAKEKQEVDEKIAAMRGKNEVELQGLKDQAAGIDTTTFAYRQLAERRMFEADLARETANWSAENAKRYRDEAVAAFELKQGLEQVIEARSRTFEGGAKKAIEDYGKGLEDVGKFGFDAMTRALNNTEDALVQFVTTGKLSFGDLINSMIADLARFAIQQAIMIPLKSFLGGLFADGGVFSGGQVQKFAAGGVVTRPTLFPMAHGMGLMGEAGPEAVMPLRRGRDGKLGVAANDSGGGASVTVNVDANGSSVQGDPGKAELLGKAIGNAVRAELLIQKRPGGLLAA